MVKKGGVRVRETKMKKKKKDLSPNLKNWIGRIISVSFVIKMIVMINH